MPDIEFEHLFYQFITFHLHHKASCTIMTCKFKYSKRQGTKAAAMPQQVDEQVKSQRSAKMLSLDEEKRKKYENYWIGKEVIRGSNEPRRILSIP